MDPTRETLRVLLFSLINNVILVYILFICFYNIVICKEILVLALVNIVFACTSYIIWPCWSLIMLAIYEIDSSACLLRLYSL